MNAFETYAAFDGSDKQRAPSHHLQTVNVPRRGLINGEDEWIHQCQATIDDGRRANYLRALHQ
jgi:hypothetical protein